MGYFFEDATGERWEIDVSVQTVIDVRQALEINLGTQAKQVFERCASGDLEFSCNLLFVVCEDQAKERGVSDRDFGKRLKNEILNEALKKFFRGLADFIQGPRGEALTKLLDAAEGLEKRMKDKLRKDLDQAIDRDLASVVAEAEASMSSSSPFNSEEKSASIPAP